MPIYEYHCSHCEDNFELIRPISQAKANGECPQCGQLCERIHSVFSTRATDNTGFWTSVPGTRAKRKPATREAVPPKNPKAYPQAVCFDGSHIWVANAMSCTVNKIWSSDGQIIGSYSVGVNPQDICFDGRNIWVSNNGGNTVTKLDGKDGSLNQADSG